jgi:hypothetical protein
MFIDLLALHNDGASGGVVQTLTQRVEHCAQVHGDNGSKT